MNLRQQPKLYLVYHRVSHDMTPYPYTVTSARFEQHLRLLADVERSQDQSFLHCIFTFDDGHGSNYYEAMPLLARYRRTAYFFVTAGWIGERAGFLQWSQVKELQGAGHMIGSHGWTHRHLTQCSEADLQNELFRSKMALEECLGSPVESISVPGGRWNKRVLRACAAAGFRQVFTSDPGTATRIREGIEIIPRVNATESLAADRLRCLLQANGRLVDHARAANRAKHLLRRILTDNMYHRLWCTWSGWKNDEGA